MIFKYSGAIRLHLLGFKLTHQLFEFLACLSHEALLTVQIADVIEVPACGHLNENVESWLRRDNANFTRHTFDRVVRVTRVAIARIRHQCLQILVQHEFLHLLPSLLITARLRSNLKLHKLTIDNNGLIRFLFLR